MVRRKASQNGGFFEHQGELATVHQQKTTLGFTCFNQEHGLDATDSILYEIRKCLGDLFPVFSYPVSMNLYTLWPQLPISG